MTALMKASQSPHLEMDSLALLMDRGADINATANVRIPQHNIGVDVFLTNPTLCRMVGRP
jgi:hypothetical protein